LHMFYTHIFCFRRGWISLMAKPPSLQRSNPSHPQTRTKMSSSFSHPTEFCIPRLPTGNPTLETTVARVQLPWGRNSNCHPTRYCEHRQVFLSLFQDSNQRIPGSESSPRNRTRRDVTIQRTHWQDRGGRKKNCKLRAVYADSK
jgi:hypothetical protein